MTAPRYDLIQQNNSDARVDQEIRELTADWERLKEACQQRDDQIERLRSENERYKEVVEKVAKGCGHDRCHVRPWITAARKALR